MKFRTQYTKPEHVKCCAGNRFEPVYSLVLDDDGKEVLKQTDAVDMFQEIQSHHDSVCLENVLARFQMGDETALEKVQGFYADVSNMPVKLNDVLNMARAGKEIFEKLPVEIKQTFGDDYMTFMNRPDLYQEAYEKYAGKKSDDEEMIMEQVEVKNDD